MKPRTLDPSLDSRPVQIVMVGAAHGLATDDYTIPYVASWASSVPGKTPVEVVQSTAERVRGAAVNILDQLETTKVGDGTPPGLDRDALAQTRDASRSAPGVDSGVRQSGTATVEAVAL